MKQLLSASCVIATAALLQGCTSMLWQREYSCPAPEPRLKLFSVGDDVPRVLRRSEGGKRNGVASRFFVEREHERFGATGEALLF